MKQGNKLRITERVQHQSNPIIIEGTIIQISKYTVTIEKLGKYGDKFRESINIADFITKRKKLQIKEDKDWEEVKLILKGDEYVLCKVNRRNNTSSNINNR
jgi:hypothetical protein